MKNLSLYIHIPFCDAKCPYCDFYSISNNSEKMEEYINCLNQIIVKYSKIYKRPLKTIYFGGGTPSIIGSDSLCKILDTIKNNFEIINNAEITLEMNPKTKEIINFNDLSVSGFNRLSIGLQSANQNELDILGRRHTIDDVLETVISARNAGFSNISLDLMICIPQQTKISLMNSIEFCKLCNVQHISSYILKYENNTLFHLKEKELQKFTDDDQAEMYEFCVKMLEAYGYKQYEISNFSTPNFESKHNLVYWHDDEYLGLGPSAHSFIDNKRFYYNRTFEDFYNDITYFESEGGDEQEYIMLALRLKEGLVFNKYRNRFNKEINQEIIDKSIKLRELGYVEMDNNHISLTTKGMLISNTIINQLFDYL